MSTLVPPQFDQYGTTFWIPSQVEPSVALIGTSLPALRPALGVVIHKVSSSLSSLKSSFKATKNESWSDSDGQKTLQKGSPNIGTYIELQEHTSQRVE